MSTSPATAAKMKRIVKTLEGVDVSFYKRTEASNYTMDFRVAGERIQESSGWKLIADAERAASKKIKELKARVLAHEANGQRHRSIKSGFATVGEVVQAMEGGSKVWSDGSLRAYKSSLLRLARVVNAEQPQAVALDAVLCDRTFEKFYAKGQGLKEVNWADSLDANGGLNSAIRNLRSIFRGRVLKLKFQGLTLPDLRPLKDLPLLRCENEGFVPWPVDVYNAMHEASLAMKAEKPEMWLVNAMLRRLGLRDEELLESKRDWIELRYDLAADGMGPPRRRAFLRVKNRGNEFALLKRGAARFLELDDELQEMLLPREGYLIANGWSDSARYDLIYRVHSKFIRDFIPDRKKSNHELRMHAGSVVYTLHGLEAAAAFLGHKSTATTEQYYAAWLAESPMVDAGLVAKARVVKVGLDR